MGPRGSRGRECTAPSHLCEVRLMEQQSDPVSHRQLNRTSGEMDWAVHSSGLSPSSSDLSRWRVAKASGAMNVIRFAARFSEYKSTLYLRRAHASGRIGHSRAARMPHPKSERSTPVMMLEERSMERTLFCR